METLQGIKGREGENGGKQRCENAEGMRITSPQYNPHVRILMNKRGWLGEKRKY